MNKLKRKLMASFCMLLVAAIMVTSTSFAWFTVSQYASAGNVEAQLMRTENIEIAKARPIVSADNRAATGKMFTEDYQTDYYYTPLEVTENDTKTGTNDNAEYHWGAVVSFDLSKVGGTLQLPATKPVTANLPASPQESDYKYGSTLEGKLCAVQYANDGRTKGLTAAEMVNSEGIDVYQYDPFPENSNTEERYKVAFGYAIYLRTNVSGDINYSYTQEQGAKGANVTMEAYKVSGPLTNAQRATGAPWQKTTGQNGWTKAENGTTDTSEVIGSKTKFTKSFKAEKDCIYYVDILVYFEGDATSYPEQGLVAADVAKDPVNGEIFKGLNATLENLTFTNSAFQTDDWNKDLSFVSVAGVEEYKKGETYNKGDKIKYTDPSTKAVTVWKCNDNNVEATGNDFTSIQSHFTKVVQASDGTTTYSNALFYEVGATVVKEAGVNKETYKCIKEADSVGEFDSKCWALTVPTAAPGYTDGAYATTDTTPDASTHACVNYSNVKTYAIGDKLTGYLGGDLYCVSEATGTWNPANWKLIPKATYKPETFANGMIYGKGMALTLDDGTTVYATVSGAQASWDPTKWSLNKTGTIPADETLTDTAPQSYEQKAYAVGEMIQDANGYALYCKTAITEGHTWAKGEWTYAYTAPVHIG